MFNTNFSINNTFYEWAINCSDIGWINHSQYFHTGLGASGQGGGNNSDIPILTSLNYTEPPGDTYGNLTNISTGYGCVVVDDFCINWTWNTTIGEPINYTLEISNTSTFSTIYHSYNVSHSLYNATEGWWISYCIPDGDIAKNEGTPVKRYVRVRANYG